MRILRIAACLLLASLAQARIVDRIAIVVGDKAVKDSDIREDLNITAFLNHEHPDMSDAARKKAASRLIDQMLIRDEIESGAYPSGSAMEAQALLNDIKRRYPSQAAYENALRPYGIDEEDLKEKVLWQLTVLKFIDARFRPAVDLPDNQIQAYYQAHKQQLMAAHPGATVDALHTDAENTLAGERVNQLLDQWLARRRSATKIVYLEPQLK